MMKPHTFTTITVFLALTLYTVDAAHKLGFRRDVTMLEGHENEPSDRNDDGENDIEPTEAPCKFPDCEKRGMEFGNWYHVCYLNGPLDSDIKKCLARLNNTKMMLCSKHFVEMVQRLSGSQTPLKRR